MPFDAADKAGLSDAQKMRLEQLLIASRNVRDPNGLMILHDLDMWIAAQMTRSMFAVDGSPLTIEETLGLEPWA